jgi:large conductance mechanosensitive channel
MDKGAALVYTEKKARAEEVYFVKKFLSEFREFAMKGNVMDLAIGVIIGGAFSAIVTSLVKSIITPLLGIVLGRVNIEKLSATIPSVLGSDPITLAYGEFLQAVLNFLIIALSIFLIVRFLNKVHDRFVKEKKEEAAGLPEPPTKTEELLAEIRDLLKENDR